MSNKKLEPGMLCRVVNTDSENDGMIVHFIRYAMAGERNKDGEVVANAALTDGDITYPDGGAPDGWILDSFLQPIKRDHQPADEEWQADFKRFIRKVEVESLRDYLRSYKGAEQ